MRDLIRVDSDAKRWVRWWILMGAIGVLGLTINRELWGLLFIALFAAPLD